MEFLQNTTGTKNQGTNQRKKKKKRCSTWKNSWPNPAQTDKSSGNKMLKIISLYFPLFHEEFIIHFLKLFYKCFIERLCSGQLYFSSMQSFDNHLLQMLHSIWYSQKSCFRSNKASHLLFLKCHSRQRNSNSAVHKASKTYYLQKITRS